MNLAQFLDYKVSAVCSIDGISIRNPTDPSTWSFASKPEATQDQKNAAQAIIDDGNNLIIELKQLECLDKLLIKRNEMNTQNITVGNNTYYADDDSVNLILQAITMQGLNLDNIFPVNWILADGTVVNLTYAELASVASAIGQRKTLNFANYSALSNQIKNSPNPNSIDITSGWSR